jgi:hypothetical protein
MIDRIVRRAARRLAQEVSDRTATPIATERSTKEDLLVVLIEVTALVVAEKRERR